MKIQNNSKRFTYTVEVGLVLVTVGSIHNVAVSLCVETVDSTVVMGKVVVEVTEGISKDVIVNELVGVTEISDVVYENVVVGVV